jgi:glycosyltransferase involved in cell wall biosynthesis
MKILMISPQFRPLVGGYERAAERLSAQLAKRGHEVTVYAEHRDHDWAREEIRDGVRVRRWWCKYARRWHSPTSSIGLAWLLVRHGRNFDVWHVHRNGLTASITIIVGVFLARPVVVKLTSTGPDSIARSLERGLMPRVTSALHRRASAIVALTRDMVMEATSFGVSQDRIRLIPNGVDLTNFSAATELTSLLARQSLGLNAEKVAVSIGRLAHQKQLTCLIAAWAHVYRRLDDSWVLVVVGDGPERPLLEASVESLGLQNVVRFVGHSSQIRDWLHAADMFVQSSSNEGLSNTMLEALATGLPVVCTDVSGAQECVNDPQTGIVVPVGDSAALAEAIVSLASDEARRAEMSARAVALIRDRYSIEHVAELHEQLYETLSRDTTPR